MALRLKNSIFCHVGRTAGHWVRAVAEREGLAVGEIGGFHDWPSRLPLSSEELASIFSFCFVRHPLSWLRSYWMHNMQFGWNRQDSFAQQVLSTNFGEFIEKAISVFPAGPVSAIFFPFVSQCSFVGRQENLVHDLRTALEQAREVFNGNTLTSLSETGVPIDSEIRAYAKAPRDILERLMAVEHAFNERWGYQDIPDGLVGDPGNFLGYYFNISMAANISDGDKSICDLLSGAIEEIPTPYVIADEAGLKFWHCGSPDYYRTATLLKRSILDALTLIDKDVICFQPVDLVLPLYCIAKGARSVTVMADWLGRLDKTLYTRLGKYRIFDGLENTQIAGFRTDGKADVVLFLGGLECLRNPYLPLMAIAQQVREGGTLVLETAYFDVFEELPLQYCPVPREAPVSDFEVSYFNRSALIAAMSSMGFDRIDIRYDFRHAVPERGSLSAKVLNALMGPLHDSDSAFGRLGLTCRKAACSPAIEAVSADSQSIFLWARWRDEADRWGAHEINVEDSVAALLQELTAANVRCASLQTLADHWQAAHKDRVAEIDGFIAERDAIGKELIDRTQRLESALEEVSALRKSNETLADETESGPAGNSSYQAEISQLLQEREANHQDLVAQTLRLDSMTGELSAIKNETSALRQEVDHWKAAYSDRVADIETIIQQREQIGLELVERTAELVGRREELALRTRLLHGKEEEVATLRERLSSLQKSAELGAMQLAAIHQENQSLAGELGQLRIEIQAVEATTLENVALKHAIIETEQELTRAQAIADDRLSALVSLNNEMAAGKQELSNLKVQLLATASQLTEARNALDDWRKNWWKVWRRS